MQGRSPCRKVRLWWLLLMMLLWMMVMMLLLLKRKLISTRRGRGGGAHSLLGGSIEAEQGDTSNDDNGRDKLPLVKALSLRNATEQVVAHDKDQNCPQ